MDANLPKPARKPRESTVVKGSVYRSIGPARQRPAKAAKTGKSGWAEDIETVLAHLERAIKNPRHPFYRALADTRESQRNIRKDGIENLHAVAHGLVTHALIDRWMLGERTTDWDGVTAIYKRWKVEEIDKRIFGKPVPKERSPKRTCRWMRAIRKADFLVSRRQVLPDAGPDGRPRAAPAFRFLTIEFFQALGATALVKKGMMRSDRERGSAWEDAVAPLREPAPVSLLRVPLTAAEAVAWKEETDPPPKPPPKPLTPYEQASADLAAEFQEARFIR